MVKAEKRAESGCRAIELIEWSDHPGCGFPSDGTELLRAMIVRGMTDMVAGLIWDPLAVSICHAAGAGVEVVLRIGGKASSLSDTPLDLRVEIERLDEMSMAIS